VILRSALVLGLCLVACVLESVFPFVFHLREARADLLLVVVLYLALNDEVIPGASLSLAAGYLSDLTSATPSCLYALLAVFTFAVVRIGANAIKTDGGIQSMGVAFAASLVHSTLAGVLFHFVAPGSEGLVLKFAPLLWSALATAFAAPLVFYVLRRLDKGFLPADAAIRVR
jgi:rod shape-determining protein MreD